MEIVKFLLSQPEIDVNLQTSIDSTDMFVDQKYLEKYLELRYPTPEKKKPETKLGVVLDTVGDFISDPVETA